MIPRRRRFFGAIQNGPGETRCGFAKYQNIEGDSYTPAEFASRLWDSRRRMASGTVAGAKFLSNIAPL